MTTRTIEHQLVTARYLLALFIVQIDEYEAMSDIERETPRGIDLASRIDGLREGHTKWTQTTTELETQLAATKAATPPSS